MEEKGKKLSGGALGCHSVAGDRVEQMVILGVCVE